VRGWGCFASKRGKFWRVDGTSRWDKRKKKRRMPEGRELSFSQVLKGKNGREHAPDARELGGKMGGDRRIKRWGKKPNCISRG